MNYFPLFSVPNEINEACVILSSCVEVLPEEELKEKYKAYFDKLAEHCEEFLKNYRSDFEPF